MLRTTRMFFLTALLALLAAAGLHLAVLLGRGAMWSAMVHLTLFGWITGMICAVNYHTMPVFSGRDFPWPQMIWLHWASLSGGLLLSGLGLASFSQALILAGLALEIVAALVFAVNVVSLFRYGKERQFKGPPAPTPDQRIVDRLATKATKGAGASLPLALLLLLGARAGWLAGEWLLAAEHLATLGWIMLMICGVAYHVLPRWGASLRGSRWARAQLICHGLALLLMVLALGFGWTWLFAIGGALMSVAVALLGWTIWPALGPRRPAPAEMKMMFKEYQP